MELENRKSLKILYDYGITKAKELSHITNIPLRTVYDVIQRFKSGNGVELMPQNMGRRKLKPNDRRRITQLALNHPYHSAKRIAKIAAERGSPQVSDRTVQRHFVKRMVFKMRPKKVPYIDEKQKQNRLKWCEKYRNFDWSRVVFTDESYFRMYEYKHRMWAKERPKKKAKKGSGFMIWGGYKFA